VFYREGAKLSDIYFCKPLCDPFGVIVVFGSRWRQLDSYREDPLSRTIGPQMRRVVDESRKNLFLVFNPFGWRDDVRKDRITGPPHVFSLAYGQYEQVRTWGSVSMSVVST
jgi:hypothetical protein